MLKYLKIWIKTIKGDFDLNVYAKVGVEYMFYFWIIFFLVKQNIATSLVLLLIFIIFRLFFRLFCLYKKLISANTFYEISLKPIDPLFGLLIYKPNPADILILFPILVYIKLKNSKK